MYKIAKLKADERNLVFTNTANKKGVTQEII